MHRADVRDHADVRPCERSELRDLPEPAHRHLDDADLGVRLDPAERQRDAELVVVVPLVRDRAGVRRAEREQDVLRRRLPVEPVIADDAAPSSGAHGAAIAARAAFASSGTSAAAAPRASACSTKSAPPPTATNRSPSRIRRESICTPVTSSAHGRATAARAARGPRPRAGSREHLARDRRGRRTGSPRRRAPSRCRRPCRRSRRRRRARVGRERVSIACRAVEHDLELSRPATSAAIAAGSSERGLSVVTIARSASRAAMRPINGRFSRSRSPPAPKTTVNRRRAPGLCGARSRASRACARSRRSRRTADPPRPTRTGPERPRARRRRARIASSSTPSSRAAHTAPSAFARLNRPRSFRSIAPSSSPGVNVRASGSVAARRLPHSSPTLTTARSAWSNSAALAA